MKEELVSLFNSFLKATNNNPDLNDLRMAEGAIVGMAKRLLTEGCTPTERAAGLRLSCIELHLDAQPPFLKRVRDDGVTVVVAPHAGTNQTMLAIFAKEWRFVVFDILSTIGRLCDRCGGSGKVAWMGGPDAEQIFSYITSGCGSGFRQCMQTLTTNNGGETYQCACTSCFGKGFIFDNRGPIADYSLIG